MVLPAKRQIKLDAANSFREFRRVMLNNEVHIFSCLRQKKLILFFTENKECVKNRRQRGKSHA